MKPKPKKPEGIIIFAIFLMLTGIGGMAGIILELILLPTFIGNIILLLMPYKYLIITTILDVVGVVLLFISSYGLFKLKSWGRILSIYSSAYLLILNITELIIVLSRFANVVGVSRSGAPEIIKQIVSIYYKGIIIYSSIFTLALYVALIYYMSRKQTKQYFLNQRIKQHG